MAGHKVPMEFIATGDAGPFCIRPDVKFRHLESLAAGVAGAGDPLYCLFFSSHRSVPSWGCAPLWLINCGEYSAALFNGQPLSGRNKSRLFIPDCPILSGLCPVFTQDKTG